MTKDELIQAVNELSTPDLEDFVTQMLELRAKRRSPSIPHSESEFLKKINQGLPAEVWERIEQFRAKQDGEILTSEEHSELVALTKKIEESNLERVQLLGELADLRGITLSELMEELKLNSSVGEAI